MFQDTAHLYDLLYSGKDYESEASVLHDLIVERKAAAASVLDVACGTGKHLEHLRTWFDIAGVDLEPAMVEIATRRLGADVRLDVADMRSFSLDRTFDAVVCLFSAIGCMQSPAELDQAIATMAAHLSSGGVLIVDGWVRHDRWREGTLVSEAFHDDDMAISRTGRAWRDGQHYHLELHHLVATIEGVDHLVEQITLTLFTEEEYQAAFSAAGLSAEQLAGPYPDRDRYIATRPS